ncbi:MAG TPA: energy transducer TonB [Acidobacteriaceae bacterium]|nr:energy transducer TonB [Acidobacteriaceae bacterium]
MATASKVEPLSMGSSVGGSGPHVEELRAFFTTRGVGFGSAEDLKPFLERLDSDASFADEMGSMVRTIIYRERDGLSRLELIELLETAVGGPAAEGNADAPEVREAARRLLAFVESVFRTRRNPGAVSNGAGQVAAPELESQMHEQPEVPLIPVGGEAVTAEAAESPQAEHPTIDRFYRARIAAEEEAAETLMEERAGEWKVEDDATEPETVLHTDLNWHVPFEDFEERETPERGSKAWLWVAGFCALLLAFCAGLFVHQGLIVPLRDPNTPYQKLPAESQETSNTIPTPPGASGARPAEMENVAASTGSTRAPMAKASATGVPGADANLRPKYMAPAAIGVSPALMSGHLVYAPPPSYPMMAQMTHIQGRVTVEAVVGKSGRVIRAKAINGHRLLRGAAVREVYGRRYRPYTVNARPMDVATLVTVDFRLKK